MSTALRAGLGLALLLGAHLPGGLEPAGIRIREGEARPVVAPLAAALRPLGALRAAVSAALWAHFVSGQVEGNGERLAAVAQGLLEVHPDLERVREHLAYQLAVSEARRAPDVERRRALQQLGLTLLDEGLLRRDSPQLHGALGRLLYQRRLHDADFVIAVRSVFGERPEPLAIEHLRRSDRPQDALLLADLLLQRALTSLLDEHDESAARRDLSEVEQLMLPFDVETLGPLLVLRDELRARLD